MDTIQMLNIILIVVIILIAILGMVALLIIKKMADKKIASEKNNKEIKDKNNVKANYITRDGKTIDSIYKFMEFDAITDNMIVRKNAKQYVMIIECKGINYDLLSEDEKNAVEMGFIEMLNTLRFPIQLYVQTRTLDLTDLIKEYKKRTDDIRDQISRLDYQIANASVKNDVDTLNRLQFEKKRKVNILEYGESIEDYTMKISESKNILQQKTYIVVSYYTSEYGDISKYSQDEIRDIAFSELYTRCQTIIRSLASAEVTGRVISSEEIAELLYVAYNRDGSENFNIRDALNADYDRLYSTAKDVMEERKRRINEQIDDEASKVAAKSIIKADEINREEREKRVKQRAQEMIDDYKDEMTDELYRETKNQIAQANLDEDENTTETISQQAQQNSGHRRRVIRRKTN